MSGLVGGPLLLGELGPPRPKSGPVCITNMHGCQRCSRLITGHCTQCQTIRPDVMNTCGASWVGCECRQTISDVALYAAESSMLNCHEVDHCLCTDTA